MKVPEHVKQLIRDRENYAKSYMSCESKLNNWLEEKGIFEKVTCGERGDLFNTGAIAMCESGVAQLTIEYLESL